MNSSDLRRSNQLAETIFNLRFEAMPVWLSDELIAYLDDRSGVMHLFAGNPITGERRQLTSGTERIQSICGTVGTSNVVIGTDAGGNERQQLKFIDLDSGDERLLTTDLERIHEPYVLSPNGRSVFYRTNDGASGEFSLYRMDLESETSTCMWSDAGQIRAHAANERGDVLASILTSNLDADLYLVSAEGERSPVLQADDESWVLDAAFTDSGKQALVLTNAGRNYVALMGIDIESGGMEPLIELPQDIEAMALSSDKSRLAWSVNQDGYSVIHTAPVAQLQEAVQADLPDGVVDKIAWGPDNTSFVVGWTPTTGPSRVYRVQVDGTAEPLFASEADDVEFAGKAPELISFDTFDGRSVPAFWFETEDRNAPVVIDVHGGPESQRRPGFHPVLQHLHASGFHVLTTNVRGSTGYGKAYSHLDDVGQRMDSVRDLTHAHEWIVSRLPGSEDRIGIMGQSYGGFMTLSAITEYPDLWYAAVDVVGISNFVTFLERTGVWRRRHREAEYGSLASDRAFLEKISPIRKVDDIQAPLFIIHGRNDPRVPLHETEQLIASLESRQHPVESLIFDNEGHGLSKRPNRISGYARVADFLWRTANRSEVSAR